VVIRLFFYLLLLRVTTSATDILMFFHDRELRDGFNKICRSDVKGMG
jgi:hypothetical protein